MVRFELTNMPVHAWGLPTTTKSQVGI